MDRQVTNADFSEKLIESIKKMDDPLESAIQALEEARESARKGEVKETIGAVEQIAQYLTDRGIGLKILAGADLRPELSPVEIAMRLDIAPEDFMRIAVESGLIGGGK